MRRLDAKDLKSFLLGQTLYAFDPDSHACIATVFYGSDGICVATFASGTEEQGCFGLSDDMYWTQYDTFRDGKIHYFYLVMVAPLVMQAYHADGERAFVQSPRSTLEGVLS